MKPRTVSEWSAMVKARDGNVCTICSTTERLHAHHIKRLADHRELQFDVDNGITLCYDCHWDVHGSGTTYFPKHLIHRLRRASRKANIPIKDLISQTIEKMLLHFEKEEKP